MCVARTYKHKWPSVTPCMEQASSNSQFGKQRERKRENSAQTFQQPLFQNEHAVTRGREAMAIQTRVRPTHILNVLVPAELFLPFPQRTTGLVGLGKRRLAFAHPRVALVTSWLLARARTRVIVCVRARARSVGGVALILLSPPAWSLEGWTGGGHCFSFPSGVASVAVSLGAPELVLAATLSIRP